MPRQSPFLQVTAKNVVELSKLDLDALREPAEVYLKNEILNASTQAAIGAVIKPVTLAGKLWYPVMVYNGYMLLEHANKPRYMLLYVGPEAPAQQNCPTLEFVEFAPEPEDLPQNSNVYTMQQRSIALAQLLGQFA